MRDLLGYAVAALIGLWTATLQPWSPQWWAGVIIASAVVLITSLHVLWNNLPASVRGAIRPVFWKPDGYLRAWVGILLLCVLATGGYVGSHWPTGFLRSTQSAPQTASASTEPTEPTASRLNHIILRCDVPPDSPTRTVTDFLWELNDYKQKLDVLGDAMGVAFTMETIRGGFRIEAEAVTDEAKQRMLPLSSIGVTKFTFEIRRLDKFELVSAIVKLPPQYAFYGWIPPNPAAPDTILVIHWVERFFSFKAGTCHLV